MATVEQTKIASPPRPGTVRHRFFSPGRVWALALNTLTELVRQKVFYFLLIFALLLIGSSTFLLQFSFQDQFQMLKAFSLGAMSIFTSLLAILPTAGLLPKDIEDRTLYTILAKPVSRIEYLLGKLCGVVLLLLLSMLLMGAMFAVVLLWRAHVVKGEILNSGLSHEEIAQQLVDLHAAAFNPNLWAGGLVIYCKACLLASMTLFVSTFASSSLFTIIVSVVVYFIGHLQSTARDYWQASRKRWLVYRVFTKTFLWSWFRWSFPICNLFNLVDEIVVGTSVAPVLAAQDAGLGLNLYFCIYLLGSYFVFSSKEL